MFLALKVNIDILQCAVFSSATSRRQSPLADHQDQKFRRFYYAVKFYHMTAFLLLGSVMYDITNALRETGMEMHSLNQTDHGHTMTNEDYELFLTSRGKNASQKSINNTAGAEQLESV